MKDRPGLISYTTADGVTLYARPDTIDRIDVGGAGTLIYFSDGGIASTPEKPYAIAERCRVKGDLLATGTVKIVPDTSEFDAAMDRIEARVNTSGAGPKKFLRPSGKVIDVVDSPGVFGAWLSLDGKSAAGTKTESLGLVSERSGPLESNYVQYRDGSGSSMPRLAIAVSPDGEVTIQALMRGEAPEASRVRHIVGIDRILEMIDEASFAIKPAAH